MIDGIKFIKDNYENINNSNNPEYYKTMFHPDVLWCPPDFDDKRGSELVGFSFGIKNYDIEVKVMELEGINSEVLSYVTGLVSVVTTSKEGVELERFILRGSWVVVNYEGHLCIKYQVWNKK